MPEKYRVTTEDGIYEVTVGDDVPTETPTSPPPIEPSMPPVGRAIFDTAVGIGERGLNAVKGLYETSATPPQPGVETAIAKYGNVGAPFEQLGRGAILAGKRMLVDPQIQRATMAREAANRGETGRSLGLSMQAGTPLIGPWLGSLADIYEREGAPKAIGAALFDALTLKLGGSTNKKLATRASELPVKKLAEGRQAITSFLNPKNTNYKFEYHRDLALPDIVREAELARAEMRPTPKGPLDTFLNQFRQEPPLVPTGADFIGLIKRAKDRLWEARESAVAPIRETVRIDGNRIARAALEQIKPYMLREDKFAGFVEQMQSMAETYRGKQIPLAEAEGRLAKLNADLRVSYNRRKGNTALVEEGLPTQANDAFANVLRDEIYGKVKRVAGTDVADLMRRYGALSEMYDAAKPVVTEIERYGRPDLAGMAAETVMDILGRSVYSRASATVGGLRGLKNMFKPDLETQLARGMEAFRGTGATIPRGPADLFTPPNKQLARGAIPLDTPDPSDVWASPAMPGVQTGQRTLATPDTFYMDPPQQPTTGVGTAQGWLPGQPNWWPERRMLPGTGETSPLQSFMDELSTQRGARREQAMQPLQLNAPAEPGIMRETVQTGPAGPRGLMDIGATTRTMRNLPDPTNAARAQVAAGLSDADLASAMQIAQRQFPDAIPVLEAEAAKRAASKASSGLASWFGPQQ